MARKPKKVAVLPFGKYRGRLYDDIAREDPGYLRGIRHMDDGYLKRLAEEALARVRG